MKLTKAIRSSSLAAAALVSGVLIASAPNGLAANSPVGVSWDCLISGSQGVGVAYVNFYDDGSLDGMYIMRPNLPAATQPSSGDGDSRNSGDVGRNTTGSTTTPPKTSTATISGVYGYGPLTGSWGYDWNNRVIGNFSQVIEGSSTDTNAVSAITNSIGFKAIVVPSQRLTMMAYMPGNRKALFSGLPMKETNVPKLNSLTESSWVGTHSGGGQTFVEFFSMAPMWQPGAYSLLGSGATYDVDGYAMLSARGRIGFATYSNGKLRATLGSFSLRTGKALTTGIFEPSSRVRFNAYHYPVVTPSF